MGVSGPCLGQKPVLAAKGPMSRLGMIHVKDAGLGSQERCAWRSFGIGTLPGLSCRRSLRARQRLVAKSLWTVLGAPALLSRCLSTPAWLQFSASSDLSICVASGIWHQRGHGRQA